jgi:hypothetical protein
MTAGTPEHDVVHSGSRWEPAAVPVVPSAAAWSVPPPAGATAPPRASRGRRALVAVAALACLLLGGLGGYLLGHAAGSPGSGSSTPAGSPGGVPGGGFGGPGDGDGDGGFRHHDLPGAGPQDGAGSGGTGTGTGTTGGNV